MQHCDITMTLDSVMDGWSKHPELPDEPLPCLSLDEVLRMCADSPDCRGAGMREPTADAPRYTAAVRGHLGVSRCEDAGVLRLLPGRNGGDGAVGYGPFPPLDVGSGSRMRSRFRIPAALP